MEALVVIIEGCFTGYWYILLAAAVIALIPDLYSTKVGTVLLRSTEPYLYVFRRYIRPRRIGQVSLDLSWIVGVAVFFIIEAGVSNVLFRVMGSVG